MFRKVLRVILTVTVVVTALLVVVAVLIYLPPVQRLIKDKALASVSASTGMAISVDRFRMKFPAVISLEDVTVVGKDGDTLLHSEHAGVAVALLPLLKSRVKARSLELTDTYINYTDSAGSLRLRGTVDSLAVPRAFVGLKNSVIEVEDLGISGVGLTLTLADGPEDDSPPDTASWKIGLAAATLSDIRFEMYGTGGRLDAALPYARIDDVSVSLLAQTVDVGKLRLDSAFYHYSPPGDTADQIPDLSGDTPSGQPWRVTVASVELTGNNARYSSTESDFYKQPDRNNHSFDAGEISVEGLDLRLDSLYNRGGDVRLDLKRLAFSEASGLRVKDASGGFSMDSTGVRLSGFHMLTDGSRLDADIDAGTGLFAFEPGTRIVGSVKGDIAGNEVLLFVDPGNRAAAVLKGKTVTLDGAAGGTLEQLTVRSFRADIPGTVDLTLEGALGSLAEPSRLNGDITFRGRTGDLGFVRAMVADSALKDRIEIPSGMNIYGSASFSPGFYAPDVTIRIDSGSLHIDGSVDTRTELYAANLRAIDFPLFRFLPRDSVGIATLTLEAKGNGFDLLDSEAASELSLVIDRFDYYNYPYSEVTLRALLNSGRLTGEFHSSNQPLYADLNIEGTISDTAYTARVAGRIANLDLTALDAVDDPLAVAGILDGALTVYRPDTAYLARIVLDTLRLNYGDRLQSIAHADIYARAAGSGVTLNAESGDMKLDFIAEVPLDSISRRVEAESVELDRQIAARSLDMAALQAVLPPLKLDLEAGTDNILHGLLLDYGYGFNDLDVSASTLDNEPLRASVVAKGFQTSGITLDTLNVWLRRNENRLEYAVRLRNRPGNIDRMGMVRARGYVEDNTAELNILQRDRQDSVGFRFGLTAELLDSAVTVKLTPENPVLGYRPWTVNSGNYFTYDFDGELYADMQIDGDGEHIHITSAPFEGFGQGAVRVDIGVLDIATTLELIPSPPPMGGGNYPPTSCWVCPKAYSQCREP